MVLGDRKDLLREIAMLKLIFKKQIYPSFKEVKDIDFSAFTVEDIGHLDEKPRLKMEKKQSDHIEDIESSDSDSSEEDDRERLEIPKPEADPKPGKPNIESKPLWYLRKSGSLFEEARHQTQFPHSQGGNRNTAADRTGRLWTSQPWQVAGPGSRSQGTKVMIQRYVKQQGLRNRHIGHFIEEVQLINRLLHPSIVLYMGMCIFDNQYAMITEFLSNGSLFDYLHKQHQKLTE